jgi:hypothetical protein
MQTLETMATLARSGSNVPGIAVLVSGLRQTDCIAVIDRFLRQNFVYRDEAEEVLRDVPFMLHDLETIGHMEGDCDDMTIMGCALLKACGLPVRMTAIKSDNADEFDHVFSEARIGEYWIPVDPTVAPGTQYVTYGFMSEAV